MKSILLLKFTFVHLFIFSLFRLVFFFLYSKDGDFSFSEVMNSFYLGARFDLRLSLILALPLVLFAWKRFSPLSSPRARWLWSVFYCVLAQVWLFIYFLDIGYYGYLGSRINMGITTLMGNPEIALGMMWESYPMIWITIGFYVLIFCYYVFLKRQLFKPMVLPWEPAWLTWGRPVLFTILLAVGLHGRAGQYPLRWSEAFFSPHHFLSNLALNPMLYFIDTAKYAKQKGFDTAATRRVYPVISDYLDVDQPDEEALSFSRQVVPKNKKPLNVIFIVMESLALSKTNLMGNSLNPTPYLESLSKKAYWFPNYYSPAEGTARNMFSIMTAIPDVTKVKTSTRNPLVVDQKLIINAYNEYKKYYFLGGNANWANIRGVFSHNIKDIEILEDRSFDKKTMDVWGISDLDLFIEAHKEFKSWTPKEKPFVAVIQAASFHRPYDIPVDSKGFKVEEHSEEDLKKAGFYSLDQYNSLKFTDYSLGYFFQLAKNSKYYESTLFVITGDHGLPDDRGENVSSGRSQLNLEKYHVPLVLINKKLFPEPKKDLRMAGHMDLMTSVASLVGVEHTNTTLGRDLFDPKYDKERFSFIYNYTSTLGEYGLLSEDLYYRYDTVKKGQLYRFDSETPMVDLKTELPDEFLHMKSVAESIYESSRYLLYHNKK